MRKQPQHVGRQSRVRPRTKDCCRRLRNRLVGKPECSPVRRNHHWLLHRGIGQVAVCARCISRIHVHRLHEPARLICANGQNCGVERSKSRRDLTKFRMQCSVSREKNASLTKSYHPSTPQGVVPVPRIPSREVLRGGTGNRDVSQLERIPPIQLGHESSTAARQEPADPERYEPLHRREALYQPPYGTVVEMIVVVVRNEGSVNERQAFERHCGRYHPTRAGKGERRRTLRPDRIGKNVHAS